MSDLQWKNTKSQRGTTLLELLVSVGLVAIVAGGMAQFFRNSTHAQRQAKIRATMHFLALDVENKMKSPSSIYLSLLDPKNEQLVECVLGTGSGCTSDLTNSASPVPFALNYAIELTRSAELTHASSTDKAIYNTNGLKCPVADPNDKAPCVFEVETFFYASCDPADDLFPLCKMGPASIHVSYSVKQIPGTLKDLGKEFRSLPHSVHFYTHQTKDILGTFFNSSCHPGAVVSGYTRRGVATCKCAGTTANGTYVRNPRFQDDRFGPICMMVAPPALTCPKTEIFRGLKDDGTANCVKPKDAYECITQKGLWDACPTGYWIQEDVRQNCQYFCTIPKSDDEMTYCTNDGVFNEAHNKPASLKPYNNIILAPPASYFDGLRSAVNTAVTNKSAFEGKASPSYSEKNYVNSKEVPDPETDDNPGQPYSGDIPIGLVCTSRILTCCRPK